MSTSFNQPRPKRAFACNEKDLYSIVSIIWNSYSKEVTKFAQYKTTYSSETAITQLANLNAVRLLPDKAARNEFHKSFRIQLKSDAIVAINAWSDISSYIRDAFPSASFKDKCNAAGHGYFNQAIAFDWDAISRLLDRGQAFISDNASSLTPLQACPLHFQLQYANARATFAAQYLIFMQAEENAKVQTDLRVSLNNALYLAVTALCSDAKKIFRYNAVMREQFTFHRVLILINGGAAHASTLTIQAAQDHCPQSDCAKSTPTVVSYYRARTFRTRQRHKRTPTDLPSHLSQPILQAKARIFSRGLSAFNRSMANL
jgi:hypothetical protein